MQRFRDTSRWETQQRKLPMQLPEKAAGRQPREAPQGCVGQCRATTSAAGKAVGHQLQESCRCSYIGTVKMAFPDCPVPAFMLVSSVPDWLT